MFKLFKYGYGFPRPKFHKPWLHIALLGLWLIIGAGVRFTLLDSKPPWNDELATLVFSLGNSLRLVPLDQPMALETLLAPLQPNSANTVGDVVHHLLTESTHPPVYFILTHAWLKLFPNEAGFVSVWAARSLSALFGIAAIPALFGFGWLTFRSGWAGQAAAALMAVSPYGVYLAQEARHYTLAILLIIASLSCLVAVIHRLGDRLPLPLWLCWVWVGINGLGIAVHYFFGLVLAAEAVALIGTWILDPPLLPSATKRKLYAVAAGTLSGVVVWIPVWRSVTGNELTEWIYDQNFLSNAIAPLSRLGVWIITMVLLLPVEGVPLSIAIACGAMVLLATLWLARVTYQGLKQQWHHPEQGRATRILIGFWLGAIGVTLCLTYGFHADLTIAARYQFTYFPAVVTLVGGAIAISHRSAQTIVLSIILGLLGSLTVVTNYGYQKPDRPDQLVPIIRDTSQVPVLIATAHQTYEQTRELMGLALEYHRQSQQSVRESPAPRFLLAHLQPGSNTATTVLQNTVKQLPRPFDLWTVNFLPLVEPEVPTCTLDRINRPLMHGYDYRLYHC
ncbi:MAG TPA: hypothetical protein V6C57_20150 [Coleofasciculaceae cyanobacterium]